MTSRRSRIERTSPSLIATATLTVETKGEGFYDITADATRFLTDAEGKDGALFLYLRHTSASLTIQENADPDVTLDLQDFFERLVPEDEEGYRHTLEGPDDMTSHIRSALSHTSVTIPVIGGRLALGTWQGLYVFEHRAHPHRRQVVLQLMGD